MVSRWSTDIGAWDRTEPVAGAHEPPVPLLDPHCCNHPLCCVPCEAAPRDTVPRPARCFSTTPGVAMPHSAEHTMVGRGVVFLPGIPPPLVPLLSQVGYYESKIIVCIQMYVWIQIQGKLPFRGEPPYWFESYNLLVWSSNQNTLPYHMYLLADLGQFSYVANRQMWSAHLYYIYLAMMSCDIFQH